MTIIANNSNFHYSITQNDEKKIVPQARHFRKQENCKPRKYFYVPLVPLRTWDNERSHLFFYVLNADKLNRKTKNGMQEVGHTLRFLRGSANLPLSTCPPKKGGQLASLCRCSSSSAYCLRSKQALQSIVSTHTSHAVACRRPTTAARGRTPPSSAGVPWFLLSLAFLLGLATAQRLGEVVP